MTQTETPVEFLAAYLNGDRKVLKQIYDRFLPKIGNMITSKGGNREDAMDVFQDALLIIFRKGKAGELKGTSGFYTLLYGTCKNVWGNRLQKKSRTEVTLSDDIKPMEKASFETNLEKEDEGKVFSDAFLKLGEDCQKLLRMFFDKKKMNEIMAVMGFGSLSYTKKRKFQCKEKLVAFVKADARFAELKI